MRIAVTTDPAEEPVTLAEVKAHLRITHSEQDTMLNALILSARQLTEKAIGRKLVTQTLQVHFDAREFAPPVVLPYGPVQSVSNVKVWDATEFTNVASSAYFVSGDKITVSEQQNAAPWPTADRVHDAFQVNYDVGYGDADAVPSPIKQAILLTIGDFYTNPETPVGTGLVVGDVPLKANVMLSPYMNYALG